MKEHLMKEHLKIVVSSSEDLLFVNIEVDKEQFKRTILPMLMEGLKKLNRTAEPKIETPEKPSVEKPSA